MTEPAARYQADILPTYSDTDDSPDVLAPPVDSSIAPTRPALASRPEAELLPLLEGPEFEAFKADIATHGQIEPIWLHPDGRILDGRNRYRACCELGIEPRFTTWKGEGSAVRFVWSLNGARRHLTPGQKALAAAEMLPMLEKEARERQGARTDIKEIFPESLPGQARDQAAAVVGVNGRYVQEAKRLQAVAPDLAAEVRQGKKNLPWARRVLAERQSQERARGRQANGGPAASVAPRVRLIVGDAARLELPDESVDVIITSPPYNLGDEDWPMGGHGRREGGIGYEDALPDEMYERWQLCVLGELFRVARPGASLFYNHKPRTRNGALLHPMAWLGRVEGWTVRQEIIWDREVTHNHSASLFWPVDERIYWLTKGKPALYGGSVGMASVWRFHGPQPYTWHPAPFPEELPRRCLQAIGGENLVVLDPFAGSCTTVKVAADMGHEGIGVDNRPEYLARAREAYGW